MTNKGFRSRKKGFSLILVILIFAGIGIIAIGAVIFSAKIKTISVERTTLKRMLVIRDAAKKYFRNQEALAAPAVGEQDVPVSAQFLNLKQDYRQDAWGQTLVYYVPPAGAGQISGVTVDGKTVAGYILSFGQNQTRESSLVAGPAINQAGDDVLVPVNVQPEAIEIVLEETTALSKKNCAYRKRNGSWQTNAAALASDYGLGTTYGVDPWQKPYQAFISAGGGHSCHFYSYGPDMAALTTDDVAGPPATDLHCVFTPPAPLHDPFDNLNNWADLRGTHAINTFAGGNALNVTGTVNVDGNPLLRESLLGLDWQAAAEDLDEAWVRAGNFLSYDAQLKAAKSLSLLDHFMGGISFRLDTSDNDLSYGVSFIKSTTLGVDGIPNEFVPPGMNNRYLIILWERTGSTAANRKWLAYKQLSNPYRTYFSDDMEGGPGNWTAGGGWSMSTSNPHSPTHCWSTGNYNNNINWSLTSNAISLPAGAVVAELRFWHRHRIRIGDWGYVELSTDGANWQTLDRYRGLRNNWREVKIDLSSYLPSPTDKIYIRFRLQSNGSLTSWGWRIDDVSIVQNPLTLATLLVRVKEAAGLAFDTLTGTIVDGDIVVGADSGASGKVFGNPIGDAGDPQAGTLLLINTTGDFSTDIGEDLMVAGAKAAETTAYRPKDNYLKVYYGEANGFGTPTGSPLDGLMHPCPRDEVNWPTDPGLALTAGKDFFTLIQWDGIQLNPTDLLMGTGDEANAVIRTDTYTSPDSGSFSEQEIGIHTFGYEAFDQKFFDDFGIQVQPRH